MLDSEGRRYPSSRRVEIFKIIILFVCSVFVVRVREANNITWLFHNPWLSNCRGRQKALAC